MALGEPRPPAAPVAVLTIFAQLTTFEGQAVFRIIETGSPDYPPNMLFRLRKGLREVTGGTR